MKRFLIILTTAIIYLLFFITWPCFASIPDFGEVSLNELASSVDSIDASAGAAYLLDLGETNFLYSPDVGFYAEYYRRSRIKIYADDGKEQANVVIPLYTPNYRDSESLSGIKGYSCNIVDGRIVKTELTKSMIFREDVEEKYALVKFVIPNVTVGSVIEFEYTLRSPFIFNLKDWNFQKDIPVHWSEYNANIPAFYEYSIIYNGYKKLDVNNVKASGKKTWRTYSYSDAQYRWVLKDVPAFKDEPFITTPNDYLSRLEFQLAKENFPGLAVKEYMSTWPELIKNLWDLTDVGKNLKSKKEWPMLAQYSVTGTNFDKAKQIFEVFRSHFQWNGKSSIYPSRSVKDLIESKVGNTADLHIFLSNVLNQHGIVAYPVIISTRDHGRISKEFPLIDGFNRMVAAINIDGTFYMLDVTDALLPFGVLPQKCLNGEGLTIHKKEPIWIDLENKYPYSISHAVLLNYNEEKEAFEGNFKSTYQGYAAHDKRRDLRNSGNEIGGLSVKNLDKIDVGLILSNEISKSVIVGQDRIYFEPILIQYIKTNPFKSRERVFPLDFPYLEKYTIRTVITVPPGYEVLEMPKAIQMRLPDNSALFTYNISNVNNVTVQIVYNISINKTRIEPVYYPNFKKIYAEIVKKNSEQIIFQKVKETK